MYANYLIQRSTINLNGRAYISKRGIYLTTRSHWRPFMNHDLHPIPAELMCSDTPSYTTPSYTTASYSAGFLNTKTTGSEETYTRSTTILVLRQTSDRVHQDQPPQTSSIAASSALSSDVAIVIADAVSTESNHSRKRCGYSDIHLSSTNGDRVISNR